MKKNIYKLLNDKGVTAIIVALLMVVFLGIAALAVDVGYNKMVRNQLQNAADAAALAAAGELGSLYTTMTVDAQLGTLSADNQALVINSARATALANQASGENVTINDDDIIIGTWDPTATPASRCEVNNFVAPNAVRVTVRRDESVAAGPITTFFARIWGTNTMNVTAQATAALSGQCTGGQSPFTITESWFESGCPTDHLVWVGEPQTEGIKCVAWNGPNRPAILNVINCVNENNCTPTQAGDAANVTNGTISNLFDDLLALFDAKKGLNDGVEDLDNNPLTWTTEVEVIDFRCGQGGTGYHVVGYAMVTLTGVMVQDPKFPDDPTRQLRGIDFTVTCRIVSQGRGGGCTGSNLGSIPSLVR